VMRAEVRSERALAVRGLGFDPSVSQATHQRFADSRTLAMAPLRTDGKRAMPTEQNSSFLSILSGLRRTVRGWELCGLGWLTAVSDHRGPNRRTSTP
jgi:hypothetical protein